MAHPSAALRGLHAHVDAFLVAVAQQDGQRAAGLMRVVAPRQQLEIVAAALPSLRDPRDMVSSAPDKLGEVLLAQLQCMAAVYHAHYAEAQALLLQAANVFLPVFRNWEGAWAMPMMHTLVYDLRVLAEKADEELQRTGKAADRLKGTGPFLMKVFGALAGKGPKKAGSLYVACQLFKTYFKLGTLNLSKSIIRVIEGAGRASEDPSQPMLDYPIRDQVTYRYYTGRLEVFNDSFTQADQRLSFALQRCPRNKPRNMRRVLKYLIPVRLSRGILPSSALLSRFHLTEYEGIVRAMRSGNVRLLRDSLEANENKFLQAGVYLVLEKLELHVYRRMIRKIHLIVKQKDAAKSFQLRMGLMLHSLHWMGLSTDADEMACIISVLIYRGFLKGYFSHKSKVLVLSKQDPFPSIINRVL